MSASNEYLADARRLLRAAREVRTEPVSDAHLCATMLYAIGFERVLKGILHEVNPLYVYKDPSFRNTVSALYQARIVSPTPPGELATKPNHDVITFRESLRRAAVFSEVTRHNTAMLYKLSRLRDLIAHCKLSLLDSQELPLTVFLHGPSIVMAYERELGLDEGNLDARDQPHPQEIEARQAAKLRLEQRIQEHRARWARYKREPNYAVHAERKLGLLRAAPVGPGTFSVPFQCPVCENEAMLQGEVDYDVDGDEAVAQGAFPLRVECPACGLVVEDSYELDEIGAAAFLYEHVWPGRAEP